MPTSYRLYLAVNFASVEAQAGFFQGGADNRQWQSTTTPNDPASWTPIAGLDPDSDGPTLNEAAGDDVRFAFECRNIPQGLNLTADRIQFLIVFGRASEQTPPFAASPFVRGTSNTARCVLGKGDPVTLINVPGQHPVFTTPGYTPGLHGTTRQLPFEFSIVARIDVSTVAGAHDYLDLSYDPEIVVEIEN